MNTFEKELCKLFSSYDGLANTTFVGSACYGDLGGDLRAKICFAINGIAHQYSSLKISVINRTEGMVDSITLRFSDLLGTKRMPGSGSIIWPHLWQNDGEIKWYGYTPSPADYAVIRNAAASYLDVFRQPMPEISKPAPKQQKNKKPRDQNR